MGTNRYGLTWKDEKRSWVEGTSNTAAINAATSKHDWPKAQNRNDTIKDAVVRLLNPAYSTSYEKFVSTKYVKNTGKPEDYLSLEFIHNNLHVSLTPTIIGG